MLRPIFALTAAPMIAVMATLFVTSAQAGYKDDDYRRHLPGYFNWTGFYGGVHASWLQTDDVPATLNASIAGDIDNDGDNDARDGLIRAALADIFEGGTSAMGGVHAGVNWQTDRWVYGLEADATFGGDLAYLASVRARAGLVMPTNVYIYGTAGVAFTELDRDLGPLAAFPDIDYVEDDGLVGFVIGGGFESALSDSMIIGLEALYYAFDEEVRVEAREVDIEQDFITLRGRVSYKFGAHTYDLGHGSLK